MWSVSTVPSGRMRRRRGMRRGSSSATYTVSPRPSAWRVATRLRRTPWVAADVHPRRTAMAPVLMPCAPLSRRIARTIFDRDRSGLRTSICAPSAMRVIVAIASPVCLLTARSPWPLRRSASARALSSGRTALWTAEGGGPGGGALSLAGAAGASASARGSAGMERARATGVGMGSRKKASTAGGIAGAL